MVLPTMYANEASSWTFVAHPLTCNSQFGPFHDIAFIHLTFEVPFHIL
jgi:hypothetical protein